MPITKKKLRGLEKMRIIFHMKCRLSSVREIHTGHLFMLYVFFIERVLRGLCLSLRTFMWRRGCKLCGQTNIIVLLIGVT
jgi:hypothetical protein